MDNLIAQLLRPLEIQLLCRFLHLLLQILPYASWPPPENGDLLHNLFIRGFGTSFSHGARHWPI